MEDQKYSIAIIDYGAGNTKSLQFALERLGYASVLTDDASELQKADRIIFPGVGAAGSAMVKLKEKGLDKTISTLTQPVLGICLGMQLLFDFCEENETPGLGVFEGKVIAFPKSVGKIPHVGWNNVVAKQGNNWFKKTSEQNYYFVHSYAVFNSENTVAQTEHGLKFTSAVEKDNFLGCQFHPEKSGEIGEILLQKFITQSK